MNFRLAHLSDIHLGPLPKVKRSELLSKRIIGYINWYRNRAGKMRDDSLDQLIAHMKAQSPDHIALTGDVVNLALDAEIEIAARWLADLGDPERVSVVPGNHDTYVPGALDKIIAHWRPNMAGDAEGAENPFPFLRHRGPLAIIGVNSGRATMPFMATGSFREKQAEALTGLLQQERDQGRFRVVLIHHPPFHGATSAHKRLIGASRFREVIARYGAELILHGHTHVDSFEQIDGPDGPVSVIGVPAASTSLTLQYEYLEKPKNGKPAARYNLFEIDGEPGDWKCTMREYGLSHAETGISLILERGVTVS